MVKLLLIFFSCNVIFNNKICKNNFSVFYYRPFAAYWSLFSQLFRRLVHEIIINEIWWLILISLHNKTAFFHYVSCISCYIYFYYCCATYAVVASFLLFHCHCIFYYYYYYCVKICSSNIFYYFNCFFLYYFLFCYHFKILSSL